MKRMRNEEAVSPVIGVILMVVITVIIAAILAVFAFGIGGPVKAPQAQLKFVVTSNGTLGLIDNSTLLISNNGGDSLILKNEQIGVKDAVSGQCVLPASCSPVLLDALPGGGVPTTGTLAPGMSMTTKILATGSTNLTKGQILAIQILDVPTGQMIADAKVTVN